MKKLHPLQAFVIDAKPLLVRAKSHLLREAYIQLEADKNKKIQPRRWWQVWRRK